MEQDANTFKKEPKSGFITEENMALLTDLYQLTMGQVYLHNNKNDNATFDLFVRRLPKERGYLVAAGLEQCLYFLKNIRFGKRAIEYLNSLDLFSKDYLDYLSKFKFTGSVDAVPEGTLIFPNEPLIRVTAPRIEAQIVETFLLSMINYQTSIASKAARIVDVASGLPVVEYVRDEYRPIVEFGLRRAPPTPWASRASYLAGCIATSNLAAGREFDIPVMGTMAHSMVLTFDEAEAFKAYIREFPDKGIFLVDTYDSIQGTKNVISAIETKEKIKSVRLDSGNKLEISKKVRKILDAAGLSNTKIFVSDDMNEYKIAELLEAGAPIDAFGVGTEMVTSRDAPALGGIYKLVQDSSGPKMKFSEGKITLPGVKQIWRISDENGFYVKGIVGLEGEMLGGRPLLIPIMRDGELVYDIPSLKEIRDYCLEERVKLPKGYRKISNFESYPVELSLGLKGLVEELSKKYRDFQKRKFAGISF